MVWPILAQSGWARSGEVLLWVLVLAAAVLLLFGAVVLVRKLIDREEPGASLPFTMDDLRRLRDEGQLSEQEYQRARERIVGMTASMMGHESEASSGSAERDAPASGERASEGPSSSPSEKSDDPEREP